MNVNKIAVENREKGQVPISIGTSLAIEAGGGVYPDRPEVPEPFTRAKLLWINLRTLVRNLYGCLPTDVKETVLPDDLWEYALEEMAIIPAAVTNMSKGNTSVVYYASDYKHLERKFPGAIIKQPRTVRQQLQQRVEDSTLRIMLERNRDFDVQLFDFAISGQFPASFIITHLPVDLLARYQFERLELLESHTGAIKGPAAWHTKLTNGRSLPNIPFNKFTLQLFGDNGNMFSPQAISLRNEMLDKAKQWNWTNVTTMDRIRDTVGKVGNDALRSQLVKML